MESEEHSNLSRRRSSQCGLLAVLRTQRVKQALGIPAPAIANQGKAMSASMLAAATSGQPIQTFTHPPTKPLAQTSRQKRAAASLKAQSLAAKSQGRS